jgi:hypothetical protein
MYQKIVASLCRKSHFRNGTLIQTALIFRFLDTPTSELAST